jgi:DTW domain-containing protein YfiP
MLHGATLVNRAQALAMTSVAGEGATTCAYVLFPSEEAVSLQEAKARGLRSLIVPDGTWTQAKRMARRDPSCVGLPHVRLEVSAPSRYRLRRNARPDGLCTFEAIAEALRALDHEDIADAMLLAFEHWVSCATLIRAGAHESRAAHSLAATQQS